MSPTKQRRARYVRLTWSLIDATTLALAIPVATWIRVDFSFSSMERFVSGILAFSVAAFVLQILVGYTLGPYRTGHVRASFEEVVELAATVGAVSLALFVIGIVVHPGTIPRGVPIIAGAGGVLLMFALRFFRRATRARSLAGRKAERRAIIYGAGEAGRRLLRNILYDAGSGITPVALLDDDRAKGRLRIEGYRVRGTRRDMAAVAKKYGADTLIIALPNAKSSNLRELSELAMDAGLDALSLPPLRDIMGGRPTTDDLRNLDVADLLGRHPVELDTSLIAHQISGRSVLVTGAGGSIGSELCRQIARFGPRRLYLLDRDESGLHATQLTLAGHGLLDGDETILADIRDLDTLREVFDATQPELVFHAAALKHLPLLETYPMEAWKTNVLGTLNMLTVAKERGVESFVNISTDKAADPSCVLGYSKRLAERLTAAFAEAADGQYVSVRFGNVLGSRGSVVHAFRAQIEQGGPVTVTHPDVKRYFMLIPEACQLVLEASSMGGSGEVMVLEMGEQVKIVDVAHTLIRLSGKRDIDVTFTGLRPGEKLEEDLFSGNEHRRKTDHPMIECVAVPALAEDAVRARVFENAETARAWMRAESRRDLTAAEDVQRQDTKVAS